MANLQEICKKTLERFPEATDDEKMQLAIVLFHTLTDYEADRKLKKEATEAARSNVQKCLKQAADVRAAKAEWVEDEDGEFPYSQAELERLHQKELGLKALDVQGLEILNRKSTELQSIADLKLEVVVLLLAITVLLQE